MPPRLTARNPERLQHAALELGALSSAAFDATDPAALEQFFRDLPTPIDHVMVTAGGMYYARVADMDIAQARRALDERLGLTLQVARHAAGKTQPGGTLLFITGTHARRPGAGLAIAATVAAAMPALVANLALELAPVRVNLIATGFVTPRCRQRFSAINSTSDVSSCAPRCRSGVSSYPTTSPRSPSTS